MNLQMHNFVPGQRTIKVRSVSLATVLPNRDIGIPESSNFIGKDKCTLINIADPTLQIMLMFGLKIEKEGRKRYHILIEANQWLPVYEYNKGGIRWMTALKKPSSDNYLDKHPLTFSDQQAIQTHMRLSKSLKHQIGI